MGVRERWRTHLKQIADFPLKVRKRARRLAQEKLNRIHSALPTPNASSAEDMLGEAELELLRTNGRAAAAFARMEFQLEE